MPVIKVIKSNIQVIFLDTFFFIDLIRGAQSGKAHPHLANLEELFLVIREKVMAGKLLCPQGHQKEEYELGQYEEEIMGKQYELALGVRINHFFGVKMSQVQIGIKAFVEQKENVVISSDLLFKGNPVEAVQQTLERGMSINVHIPRSQASVYQDRKLSQARVDGFEQIRKQNLANKTNYREAYKAELKGELYSLHALTRKLILLKAANEHYEALNALYNSDISYYNSFFSHYVHEGNSLKAVEEYLASDYFQILPFIDVYSCLLASITTQPDRKISLTDYFDILQASQTLPFASYYFTDRNLAHRLSTNPVNLAAKYGVKIYSTSNITRLIADLKAL